MSNKNGGSAFPIVESHPTYGTRIESGMSLRDWFAGMALQGNLAGVSGNDDFTVNAKSMANWCYELADAMLAERKE